MNISEDVLLAIHFILRWSEMAKAIPKWDTQATGVVLE